MKGIFEVQVHSPRMLCPCGQGVRVMTQAEREDYDHALRRVSEERKTETDTAPESGGQSKEVFTTTHAKNATTPD